MSSRIQNAKEWCDTTGECEWYESVVQQEYESINRAEIYSKEYAIQQGLIFSFIGLLVLLIASHQKIKKVVLYLLSRLTVIAPIIIGLAGGAAAGFGISFSACFKQTCNIFESSSIWTLPLLGLLISIPITRYTVREKTNIETFLHKLPRLVWIVIGLSIFFSGITFTIAQFEDNKASIEIRKKQLLQQYN